MQVQQSTSPSPRQPLLAQSCAVIHHAPKATVCCCFMGCKFSSPHLLLLGSLCWLNP